MYPYRDRTRWLLANRYGHLVQALDHRRRPVQDTTLEARVEAMRFWNRVRALFVLLISLGLLTAASAFLAQSLPAFDKAFVAIGRVAAAASTLSGVFTLVYLFVVRLLGQLEVDILTILTLDHSENP